MQLKSTGHEREVLPGREPQAPARLQAAFPPLPVEAHNVHMQREQSKGSFNFYGSQHRGMIGAQRPTLCFPIGDSQTINAPLPDLYNMVGQLVWQHVCQES